MTFRSLFIFFSFPSANGQKKRLPTQRQRSTWGVDTATLSSVLSTTDHLSALIQAGFLRGSLATESWLVSTEASINYNWGPG